VRAAATAALTRALVRILRPGSLLAWIWVSATDAGSDDWAVSGFIKEGRRAPKKPGTRVAGFSPRPPENISARTS
jgi:hypothetical protein